MKNKALFIFLTGLIALFISSELQAAPTININSSNVGAGSGWKPVFPQTAQYDFVGDTRVGNGDSTIDIAGNAIYPAAYIQFNDTGSEIAVRIRVNNCDRDSAGIATLFNSFAYIGIDANFNGTVDFFLGAYNPTGPSDLGHLGIYPAHPDAFNNASGLTGIADTPLRLFTPQAGINYSFMQTADGSAFSGTPDYFITFKFNVADITNAIAGKTKENVTFTPQTPFSFIVGTSTLDNILSGDVCGVDEINGPYPEWYSIYPQPVSTDGKPWSIVTFDSNGGEIHAVPTEITVRTDSAIRIFPTSPAKRQGWRFIDWSLIPNDNVPLTQPFTLGTTISSNKTVYAIWQVDSTGYVLYEDGIVHFDPSGGSWAGGMTYYDVESVDGSIPLDRMPPTAPLGTIFNPPPSPPYTKPTGGRSWVFGGWVTQSTLYNSPSTQQPRDLDVVIYQGNDSVKDIEYFNWTQHVTDLAKVMQPHSNQYEYTVYALWLQAALTGGNAASTLYFYDNIYDTTGATSYPRPVPPYQYGTLLYTSFASSNNSPIFSPMPITRQGYTFRGWDTKQDGTGTRYLDPANPNAGRLWMASKWAPAGTDFYLYAIWEPDNFAVQFLPNTVDYDMKPLNGVPTGNFGYVACPVTSYGIIYPNYNVYPGAPTLYGYRFIGWNTKKDGTGLGVDPYVANALIKAGDQIRFSLFSQPAVTVKLVVNGQTLTMDETMTLYALWQKDTGIPPVKVLAIFDAMGGLHVNTSDGTPPGVAYYAPGDLAHAHHLLNLTATDGYLPFIPTPVWSNQKFTDGTPYYTFQGWSFSNAPDRTVAIPPTAEWYSDPRLINDTGDPVYLYAVWQRNFKSHIIINKHLIQRPY